MENVIRYFIISFLKDEWEWGGWREPRMNIKVHRFSHVFSTLKYK
jgi:hypothetical protein